MTGHQVADKFVSGLVSSAGLFLARLINPSVGLMDGIVLLAFGMLAYGIAISSTRVSGKRA